jgi:hypothetical protein
MSDLRMELIQGQLQDIEENVRSIKATWGNTIMTLDNIKSNLKADRQKAIDEAYQKGLNDSAKVQESATDAAYQCGLNAAWQTAKYLFSEMTDTEINLVFPQEWNNGGFKALMALHPQDAIDRIKAYEEQKKAAEIKVGDEVCFVFAGGETIEPFIVFSIKDDNGKKYYEGIQTSDGRWVSGGLKYYKTGRHFSQVEKLLKAMKEGAE